MRKMKIIYWMVVLGFLMGCGQGKVSMEASERPVDNVTKMKEMPPPEDEEVKTSTGSIHKSENYNKNRDIISPEIFTQINDFDSLGRPYVRWIEFRDTSSGQLLSKIDIIERDNPYFQSGLKVNCVDENGPKVYYTLGKQADKNMVKPFLPEEQYNTIANDFLYPMALSMIIVNKVGNDLIVNYSFEWGGLEREWIRGEYIGHAVMVYDQKGNLKYSNINTPGELSYISPSGNYLFFIENKYHDDWEKQTGCLSIFSRRKKDFIFSDCRIHSEWFKSNTLLGNNIKFLCGKRNATLSDKILLFHPVSEKKYFLKLSENETIKLKKEGLSVRNILTNKKKIVDINDFEILTEK